MSAIPLIVPQWSIDMPNVGACMTTRQGGQSVAPYGDLAGVNGLNLGTHVGDELQVVTANRHKLSNVLPKAPAWLTQVHGKHVLNAAQVVDTPEADASIATEKEIVCTIMTADCLPVLLADVDGKVVGAAHAGWRGLAGGVLENTVAHMRGAGAEQIQAWLGPAIGPEKFEVGTDVLDAFLNIDQNAHVFFKPIAERAGKYLADIYGLARMILAQQNVTLVTGGDRCTVSEAESFYSFRRDGVTGRMAALIWLR